MLKINFLGDSITEGACATKPENCYVELVGSMLKCVSRNYGVSGTRIAKQINKVVSWDYLDYQIRAHGMNNDADYVFVMGGVNDFGHGDAPLFGKDKFDPYSFSGGLHNLCRTLLEKFDRKKIAFILPLHCIDENPKYTQPACKGKKYEDYLNILRNVCREYGFDVLDFQNIFGMPEDNLPSDLYQDGLHPNDKGHELLAKLIVEYIKGK